jgi:hypothetical protein
MTVHDPLRGVVMVVAQGGRARAALVYLDLIGMPVEGRDALRKAIGRAVDLDADSIVITTTHNHSAGRGVDWPRLGRMLAELAERARAAARPARVGWARGQAPEQIAMNRRVSLGEDFGAHSVIFNDHCRFVGGRLEAGEQIRQRMIELGGKPDRDAPEAVRAGRVFPDEGVIDPMLDVIAMVDSAGRPLATLVRYTMHPVIVSKRCGPCFSADWPGQVAAHIAERTGAPCLVVNGCCGDVRPLHRGNSFQELERIGGIVAEQARRLLDSLQTEPLTGLAVGSIDHAVPIGRHVLGPLEQLRQQEAELKRRFTQVRSDERASCAQIKRAWEAWARQRAGVGRRANGNSLFTPDALARGELPWDPCGLRLNDLLIAALPGENFVEIALAARRLAEAAANCRAALVVEEGRSGGGGYGYYPTAKQYPQGGYEGCASAGDERSEAALVAGAKRLCEALCR